jgi:hypothetical protein
MDRRRLPRIAVDIPVQVRIFGDNKNHAARIENISQGGLRFISDVAFPLDEVLQFDLANYVLIGAVRYCALDTYPLAIGIELPNMISKPDFDALLQVLVHTSSLPVR